MEQTVLQRPEILAPAGNADMLRAAVFAGADAVYLGLDGYNARRSAGNFDPDALREAVCFCHARGVAVHVTLNTLVYAAELGGLADAVRAVAAAGADAVIVDDLATAQLVRSIAPGLRLHGSTQMSIHTAEGAKMLAKLGYSRAILARELSLAEIEAVVKASPIECEVFVHGAMCMSMSGQCMMSAFLGGRSGNRGACAGPCRLPFDATNGLRPGQPGKACHLSLKDMDLVPHMAQLKAAGVASIKIEGRLRTPEYAAAAVTACRAARAGQPYDEALLRDIFSRSGFSDAYLVGRNDGTMFGVRTEADAAATRAATPKARELFRRELERIPVHFCVSGGVEDGGIKLTAFDDNGSRVNVYSADEPQPAQKDPAPGIERALGKTGGTPFTCAGVEFACGEGGPGFLPGSAWNEMRREALDKLLQKRSEPAPLATKEITLPEYAEHEVGMIPQLAARFETAAQLPGAEYLAKLRYLILPIREADAVPQPLRCKTLLELPRAAFGTVEPDTMRRLAALEGSDFAGVVANNLAQFGYASPLAKLRYLILPIREADAVPQPLRCKTLLELPRAAFGTVEPDTMRRLAALEGSDFAGVVANNLAQFGYASPLPVFGGLGLNVTNPMSAAEYVCLGACGLLVQPETALTAMRAVAPRQKDGTPVPTAALCYGHLPLMLTRACPLRNVRTSCAGCTHKGKLRDRKGRDFPVRCSAPGSAGMRTVFNPVPLYMGDRLTEMPVDLAVAAFTLEPADRVEEVLTHLFHQQPFDGEFTRGLYYTNN